MEDFPRFNEWISNAIMRCRGGIEELGLFSYQRVELPPSIFSSQKLVKRKLGIGNVFLDVPASVCLPSMKVIHLHWVQLCNDDSMKNLLGGCPVLEELEFMTEC